MPQPGDRVTVATGPWTGRVGTLSRYDTTRAGPREVVMPVVDLDPDGPRKARTVRVRGVVAGSWPSAPDPVTHLPCGCNRSTNPAMMRWCIEHRAVLDHQERLWWVATYAQRLHTVGEATGGFHPSTL